MQKKSFSPIELVALLFLLMTVLAGLSGAALMLLGDASFFLALVCLSPAFAAVVGMVLVALRRRPAGTSGSTTVLAALLLVIGFAWMGFGGFTLEPAGLEDSSLTVMENLGMSAFFCFAPGGILSLLGLGAYWYDVRGKGDTTVSPAVAAAPEAAPSAAAGAPAALPETANSNVLMYQARLTRAGVYREKIMDLIGQAESTAFRDQMSAVAAELERWEGRVQQLVQRLTAFEQNSVVQHDRQAVPEAIARLERQLTGESDPEIQRDIEETLASYRKQETQLEGLARLMRRTQLDLEETVAAMGTLYSQMEILGAREIDGSRARRLSHDISEQVERLNDLLTAVDEVYSNTSYHA